MNPEHAKAICEYIVANLEMEATTTERVIAAVPATGVNYSPDTKSMKALDLAWHIVSAEIMLMDMGITGGEVAPPERAAGTETTEGIIAWYKTQLPLTLAKVRALSNDHLAKVVTVWGGAYTLPCVTFVNFAMKHTVHHRGQLAAYLRPMGAKVPGIYGPSGDDAPTH